MPIRDYTDLLTTARDAQPFADPPPGAPHPPLAAMRAFLDLVWTAFGDANPTPDRKGISWIGFYAIERDANGSPTSDMILLAREPKPACSPIGLHGLCGRGWRERTPFVIDDVRTLGANYVACDPRDQSELVIPCFLPDGSCWGVLDADGYAIGAFEQHDVENMTKLLTHLAITTALPITAQASRPSPSLS